MNKRLPPVTAHPMLDHVRPRRGSRRPHLAFLREMSGADEFPLGRRDKFASLTRITFHVPFIGGLGVFELSLAFIFLHG